EKVLHETSLRLLFDCRLWENAPVESLKLSAELPGSVFWNSPTALATPVIQIAILYIVSAGARMIEYQVVACKVFLQRERHDCLRQEHKSSSRCKLEGTEEQHRLTVGYVESVGKTIARASRSVSTVALA